LKTAAGEAERREFFFISPASMTPSPEDSIDGGLLIDIRNPSCFPARLLPFWKVSGVGLFFLWFFPRRHCAAVVAIEYLMVGALFFPLFSPFLSHHERKQLSRSSHAFPYSGAMTAVAGPDRDLLVFPFPLSLSRGGRMGI